MKISRRLNIILRGALLTGVLLLFIAHHEKEELVETYRALESRVVFDRGGNIISLSPNPKGYSALYTTSIPKKFGTLLLQKEDRFFYLHPGLNPLSTIRAFLKRETVGTGAGGSTITQQLAKNLYGNENSHA